MRRCIQLALLGKGYVAPNPMVGAVIVHDGRIIGEGYHKIYGEAHAEVNAINEVKHRELLLESTIYVSLEPCSHHGKTPPCADLLVKNKFKHVVIGCRDSYSEVSGKGIERLKSAGIDVTVGVLESECRSLNKRFFYFHEKKRPYIFLKWAQTPNGLLDNKSKKEERVSWISVPEMKARVHYWRSENQAIMVGRKTVEKDNPSLTVRAVTGKNPVRVIIDPDLKLGSDYTVFDGKERTVVINTIKESKTIECEYAFVKNCNAESIASKLYELDIHSVMIEGGGQTLRTFIDSNMWDEVAIITGQYSFEAGTKAPLLCRTPNRTEYYFGDRIDFYINT